MDFIEFKLWKAGVILVLAFLAGLFGFIRPERGEEQSDKDPE